MSASSDYQAILARITAERGASAAAAIRARAQATAGAQQANSAIWGQTLSNLGQYVSQIPAQRAEMERIKNQAEETKLRREQMQRQATREQQEDADDQKLRDLFTIAHQEFQQGQGGGLVSQADGVRIGDAIEREKAAGTYRGPDDSGQMLPTPMTVAGGTGTRQTPFPTPDELLRTVGPKKAIPIINAMAALKTDPRGDPEKSLKMLQQVANGLNALPEDMRAAAYPEIVKSFEQRGIVKPGMLQAEYSPDYWKFIMGTGIEPPRAPTPELVPVPGPNGPVYGPKKEGAPVYEKPSAASESAGSDYHQALVRYAKEHNKKVEDLTFQEELEVRKKFGQADDRTAGAQAADITNLTPAGIDMAALNYRKTGTLPPLGMGDRTTRQKILNRAAELTAADIQRIESGGTDVAGNRADYRADSTSLVNLQKQRDAIGAFEQTAQKNIDNFLEVAKKVPDTGIPLLNTPVRWIAGAGGSADVAKYQAARQVAISEIAKIVQNPNLAGQLSDSARHEIDVFNPQNATLAQTKAVMELLKRDMENRKTALDAQLKETRGRIGGTSAPATPAGPKEGDTKPIPGYPGTEQTFKNGKWIRTK